MKAVVIGGGIIGLSSAYYLQKSGWDVTVLDKTDMTDSCSYGNLGMVVPSHFVPLAAPGMLSQGIRWMFNNRSPFYVKPSLNPELIGWGLKFMKSATAQHLERSGLPLLNLNLYSKKLYENLQHEPGFDFGYENKGILMYFKTEKFAEEEIHLGKKAKSMGIDVEPLTKAQVQLLEPETELDILGAVHYKSDSHLYPNKLVPQLISHLRSAGVKLHGHSEVKGLDVVNGRVKKVVTTDNEYEGDIVVMVAGSWLSQLAKMASFKLPLMPGEGYSFTYRKPERKLNVPAILCEARVAITQMNGYMRYGGTMEIGPVNNKINMNRVQGIVESVPKYFPGIQLGMPAEKDIWYGFRPCSPDGLPYLGRSSKVKNVLVAGGHAMSGISLGPASGKVMADLANDQKPEVDISIFDPQRFS